MADQELTIPRAALKKMIKELLPNTRVSSDSRELILNCCTEFIHLISSEANDICNQQKKKMITPDHALAALKRLGFETYCPDAEAVIENCKAVATEKKRRKGKRLDNLGIPQEELLRQQKELFAKAREEEAQKEKESLDSESHCPEAEAEVKDCKEVVIDKKRQKRKRSEDLDIPEEELILQQELVAKAREEQKQTKAEAIIKDCKIVVTEKKRRKRRRLDNLEIPEELLRQQESFAKAREEQKQTQISKLQWAAQQQLMQQNQQISSQTNNCDDDDYDNMDD